MLKLLEEGDEHHPPQTTSAEPVDENLTQASPGSLQLSQNGARPETFRKVRNSDVVVLE